MSAKRLAKRLLLRHRAFQTEPMWIDDEGAEDRISRIQESWMRDAIGSLRRDGIAILKGNIDEDECRTVLNDFDSYVRSRGEAENYRDEFGLHERLASFHLVSNAAQALAENPLVIQFLSTAFQTDPMVVGSLFFEKGSEQSIHRDTPSFFTNPLNHYFGVWTALEDVTETSGPLTYFRGGHKILSDLLLYEERLAPNRYFETIIDACMDAGLEKVEFCPEIGDTLIWHPQTPHGGSARRDSRKSRKSIVVHYMPSDATIFGPSYFFAGQKVLPVDPGYNTVRMNRLSAIDHGVPRFFHNRKEGNFDEL